MLRACPLSLPLDFAIFGGFNDVAELIIQNNREIINEGLYVHLAIEAKVFSDQQDNSKIVDLLLKNGANINARNEMNRTPLHNATELRKYEIIQLLLYYKADIDAFQWPGRTPLQIAIISNDKKATKILLKNGANPNLTSDLYEFQFTPLHIGITCEHFDMVELLIAYNADLNLKDRSGDPTMHLAIHTRNMKIMKLLLMNGVCVNTKDLNGNNAVEKALNLAVVHVAKIIWLDQM